MIHICHPSHARGWQSRLAQAKNVRPYPQNTKEQKARGMAQMVEHLPCKHEALTVKPEYHQKKKKFFLYFSTAIHSEK
jgi:hypothetical protein